MKHLPIILLWCVLLPIVACTPTDDSVRVIPETQPLTTRAWQCDTNSYVVTSHAKDSRGLWIFLPGQTTLLPPASDNSDMHFGKNHLNIKFNGMNAELNIDGQMDSCRENRPMSIREDAKLRGVDFWATGNEPPWRLEISAATLILKTGYENVAHEFATPEPTTESEARITRYETHNMNEHLLIRLEGRICNDSMSGEEFATSVTLVLDENELHGCGQALH
jgi:uncharacterized membrane protein